VWLLTWISAGMPGLGASLLGAGETPSRGWVCSTTERGGVRLYRGCSPCLRCRTAAARAQSATPGWARLCSAAGAGRADVP